MCSSSPQVPAVESAGRVAGVLWRQRGMREVHAVRLAHAAVKRTTVRSVPMRCALRVVRRFVVLSATVVVRVCVHTLRSGGCGRRGLSLRSLRFLLVGQNLLQLLGQLVKL